MAKHVVFRSIASAVCTAALVAGMSPAAAFAAQTETANQADAQAVEQLATAQTDASGAWGTNLTWTYDAATKTVTISGKGAMKDYSGGNLNWWGWKEAGMSDLDIEKIVISQGVTTISYGAFRGCSSLVSVEIPKSVTRIGYYAFSNCAALTSVDIPEGVKTIAGSAFRNDVALTSVTIPAGVTKIDVHTFDGCTHLASISLPEGVASIEEEAFWNCTALESVDLPVSLTRVGECAFGLCRALTDVNYAGTETDRAALSIAGGNDRLASATWHYGSAPIEKLVATATTKTVAMGKTASISCEVEGAGASELTYQWQYSTNQGAVWVNSPATGATTSEISFPATQTRAKNLYRCIVTSSDGRVTTSNEIALDIVNELTATASTTAVKCGYKATFECAVEGAGASTLAYQWQYSTDGGASWRNVTVTGAKTAAYSVVANAARANNLWRCVVTASDGRVATTGPIGIKVSLKVTVATSPVAAGKLQSFVSTTSGYGSCSFTRQWQVSKDGGETWAASTASTATAKTLKVTATKARAQAGWLYRCVVTAGGYTAVSVPLAIQVK